MATKTFTLAECQQHTTEKDCWLIIHGKVFDVTNFLDEHPGGYDIVVSNTGKDATEDFEEIGHSLTAKEMLDQYYIGEYSGGDSSAPKRAAAAATPAAVSSGGGGIPPLIKALLPLLVLAVAVYVAMMAQKQ